MVPHRVGNVVEEHIGLTKVFESDDSQSDGFHRFLNIFCQNLLHLGHRFESSIMGIMRILSRSKDLANRLSVKF